jgi:chromosome segregation ATPase
MTEETVAAPALGYSILANLGDEKQLTVQCFADSEEDIASIHSKVDKAMAVVDRQKAKYKARDLRSEVAKMERTLRQLEDDLARLETDFEANQEAIDRRIAECGEGVSKLQSEAHARGRAQPVGADKAAERALRQEAETLNEQKNKAIAERAQARANTAVNIGRYREEIDKANEHIAECEALIGDGG